MNQPTGFLLFVNDFLSVVVIGHGIGGKDIPTKMARLANSQMLE